MPWSLGILTTGRSEDGKIHITLEVAQECIQKRAVRYDKDGDNHYDTISAFIKSMRGSDPDAAVYYLARMLYAGEDIKFIARRIMICASEDVGNADPQALCVAVSAAQAVERIGMPEAQIILSQAVTYVASAPKSNAAYMAVSEAMDAVKNQTTMPVPAHLQDAHYKAQPVWDEVQDICMLMTTPIIMWHSNICRMAWKTRNFITLQRWDMKKTSGNIWNF